MGGVLKFSLWFKIFCLAFTLFFVAFLLFALLTVQEDEAVFIAVLICSIFGVTFFILTIWAFFCKITVGDEFITIRKFLITKTFKYEDITNIKYKKQVFGSFAYIIKFGRTRVEISQFMTNRNIIDKKLKAEGVFKKYPQVSN